MQQLKTSGNEGHPQGQPEDQPQDQGWLFNYPGRLKPSQKERTVSLTKETYTVPQVDCRPKQGRRKKLLEDFYRELISKQFKEEMDENPIFIEDYETDYSEHFKHPNEMLLPGESFSKQDREQMSGAAEKCPQKAHKHGQLEKMKLQYPLYGSRALTYHAHQMGRDNFGIATTISKPINENFSGEEY